MTPAQSAALQALQAAMQTATDSGLFDTAEVWGEVNPDVVNRFADMLGAIQRPPQSPHMRPRYLGAYGQEGPGVLPEDDGDLPGPPIGGTP